MVCIPVIDFGPWKDGSETQRSAISQEILEACQQSGFFYLKNTTVTSKDVSRLEEIAKAFFDMPLEEKERFPINSSNVGYSSLEQEKLDPKLPGMDSKECFNLKPYQLQNHESLPNVLRKELSIIKEHLMKCDELCRDILRAFAIAFGILDDDGGSEYFVQRHDASKSSGSVLRLLHYPPINPDDASVKSCLQGPLIRAGCHSDYGSITLLSQTGVGGLQVLSSEDCGDGATERWIDVPVKPNHILINTGDLMEFWSASFIRSTKHRVVYKPDQVSPRYSIVYFCHPNDDVVINCIPTDMIPKNTLPREGVTASQYLAERLKKTYLYYE